jgi:hypothetical protein
MKPKKHWKMVIKMTSVDEIRSKLRKVRIAADKAKSKAAETTAHRACLSEIEAAEGVVEVLQALIDKRRLYGSKYTLCWQLKPK